MRTHFHSKVLAQSLSTSERIEKHWYLPSKLVANIEDITWPRWDTGFIFSCWKYLSQVSEAHSCRERYFQHEKIKFVSPSGHVMFCLFYRYWWNTRIFPLTKKSYRHRPQWRYYFYLSRVRILVSPWLLTYAFAVIESFFSSLEFWLFGTENHKYFCLYFFFITLYPSFITFLWQAFCNRWPLKLHYFALSKWIKKSCVLCRNFAHSWEIFSALQDKIISPRGHVISSISTSYCY